MLPSEVDSTRQGGTPVGPGTGPRPLPLHSFLFSRQETTTPHVLQTQRTVQIHRAVEGSGVSCEARSLLRAESSSGEEISC